MREARGLQVVKRIFWFAFTHRYFWLDLIQCNVSFLNLDGKLSYAVPSSDCSLQSRIVRIWIEFFRSLFVSFLAPISHPVRSFDNVNLCYLLLSGNEKIIVFSLSIWAYFLLRNGGQWYDAKIFTFICHLSIVCVILFRILFNSTAARYGSLGSGGLRLDFSRSGDRIFQYQNHGPPICFGVFWLVISPFHLAFE